jgi:hypothetical protein
MAENKTQATPNSVADFIASIADEKQRGDCEALVGIFQKATKSEPRMWGPSIVGFGDYHYRYESGREGDWFYAGFSPRKAAITLYFCGYLEFHGELLAKLGKYKSGKGCLYIKSLADVDAKVLRELIVSTVREAKNRQKNA